MKISKTVKIANQPDRLAIPETMALRHKILSVSEQLLHEVGLHAFSMREVARRAGVTHQAPYHYFVDREGILMELVAQGYAEFGAGLRKAIATVPAVQGVFSQTKRIELAVAVGSAYVGYALDHPALFRLLFRSELYDISQSPSAIASRNEAFAALEHMVVLLHGTSASHVKATVYWAQVHGLASLMLDGPLEMFFNEESARAHLLKASLKAFANAMLASKG